MKKPSLSKKEDGLYYIDSQFSFQGHGIRVQWQGIAFNKSYGLSVEIQVNTKDIKFLANACKMNPSFSSGTNSYIRCQIRPIEIKGKKYLKFQIPKNQFILTDAITDKEAYSKTTFNASYGYTFSIHCKDEQSKQVYEQGLIELLNPEKPESESDNKIEEVEE